MTSSVGFFASITRSSVSEVLVYGWTPPASQANSTSCSSLDIWLVIHHFAVLPDKQGAGFGTALMNHIVKEARRSGNNIALAATEGMLRVPVLYSLQATDFRATLSSTCLSTEAAGFYEKFGFIEVTPARMLDGVKLVRTIL